MILPSASTARERGLEGRSLTGQLPYAKVRTPDEDDAIGLDLACIEFLFGDFVQQDDVLVEFREQVHAKRLRLSQICERNLANRTNDSAAGLIRRQEAKVTLVEVIDGIGIREREGHEQTSAMVDGWTEDRMPFGDHQAWRESV